MIASASDASDASDAIEELELLLRPAGGGLYLVSTGRAEQLALQRKLYGVTRDEDVDARFRETLRAIEKARVVILGVPSDVGAGFLRGANLGPQAIRTELLAGDAAWSSNARAKGVVDIGDVFVVPQLLHDSMLAQAQIDASRRALYPNVEGCTLPVSPLSIEERALDLVMAINPKVKPVILGGDHSTAWPVAAALGKARKGEAWGIVQPDAHTDLLPERLGVRYCFATWSYHANDLIGRDGRMVEVGIRASRFPREHWESTLGVRQFWAAECLADPEAAIDAIVMHLQSKGVSGVYFSNDIDGTDERFANATGTPEPGGLEPEFVVALIRRLGKDIGLIAGDVVEVAPLIPRRAGGTEETLKLAARYLEETLSAMLTTK